MKKLIFVFFLILPLSLQGQEVVTLTTPVTKPNQTNIKIERFNIDVVAKTIYVQWLGNNNEAGSATYSTPAPSDHPSQPTGASLLTTLNKMNFSAGNPSLVARILTRLQTDGYIPAGSISGTPE